jgi:ribosomal protein S18 acetylase RimI-like enzyme
MRGVTVVPFDRSYVDAAAELFCAGLARLRSSVPALPDTMATPEAVAGRLAHLADTRSGVAALRQGQVVGYLGWYFVDGFRGTGRRAAYCPVWSHATTPQDREQLYPLMYRAASERWTAVGCGAHAVTLLADDTEGAWAFSWTGFGISVVDALRTTGPLGAGAGAGGADGVGGVAIRAAVPSDLGNILAMEAALRAHQTRPPVLMAVRVPEADRISRRLVDPAAGYWLATAEGGRPVGFLRCDSSVDGATELVASDTTVAISGCFVHPAARGRGVATTLLDTVLREYATRGFARCSVDFESFNPEATGFWLRHFEPVCLSVIRYPEFGVPRP